MGEEFEPESLGSRIGAGGVADVLDYGKGRVIKLFRPGYCEELVMREASLYKKIFLSGAISPWVGGSVRVGDQYGFVMEKYDGATLNTLVADGYIGMKEAGYILAEAAYALHHPGYSANIQTYKELFYIGIGQLIERGCPIKVIIHLEECIGELAEGRIVCHGDMQMNNIIMTQKGPRLVDWANASLAEPYLDVARVYLAHRIEFEEILKGFITRYSILMGVSTEELHAEMSLWLPIVYVRKLLKLDCHSDDANALYDIILGT